MNKLKRKSLYLALAASLGAAGVAGSASAVNINGDGLGQVLIFPYYTVRNGTDTYLSVTNTSSTDYKAVKVRFTEGRNSREVKDFNLYLSPNDMWTGVVIATANGATLQTTDLSCTSPAIPSGGTDFVNYGYSGATVEGIVDAGGDGESQSLDRTREGYFEIIEMGIITNTADQAAILHTAGIPGDCTVVQAPGFNAGASGGAHAASAPTGGLAGRATLINVAEGTEYGYDPTVLANFSVLPIWFAPGTIQPDLRAAFPPISNVYNTTSNANISDTWNAGTADSVTAVLMHAQIINDYILDTATLSGTDWVVTMPTKRYYVPVDDPSIVDALVNPIGAPFTQSFWLGGACEPVGLAYWDREEQYVANVDFSPPPPTQVNALCWESTVVTFNNSNVFGSSNVANIPVNFAHGWADITLSGNGHTLINSSGHTYSGLPVVGFMAQDYVNGNVGGVLSNYGGNFNHKYVTTITP